MREMRPSLALLLVSQTLWWADSFAPLYHKFGSPVRFVDPIVRASSGVNGQSNPDSADKVVEGSPSDDLDLRLGNAQDLSECPVPTSRLDAAVDDDGIVVSSDELNENEEKADDVNNSSEEISNEVIETTPLSQTDIDNDDTVIVSSEINREKVEDVNEVIEKLRTDALALRHEALGLRNETAEKAFDGDVSDNELDTDSVENSDEAKEAQGEQRIPEIEPSEDQSEGTNDVAPVIAQSSTDNDSFVARNDGIKEDQIEDPDKVPDKFPSEALQTVQQAFEMEHVLPDNELKEGQTDLSEVKELSDERLGMPQEIVEEGDGVQCNKPTYQIEDTAESVEEPQDNLLEAPQRAIIPDKKVDGDEIEEASRFLEQLRDEVQETAHRANEAEEVVSELQSKLVETETQLTGKEDEIKDARKVLEQLRDEVLETTQRANEAEEIVSELQSKLIETETQLIGKERELSTSIESLSAEKGDLLSRVDELGKLLETSKANEKKREQELFFASSQKEADLAREVNQLKASFNQTKADLRFEKEKANALKERLEDAEDKYEFEQMRFEKEKQKSGVTYQEQRLKLVQIEKMLEENQIKFERERQRLEERIKDEAHKLRFSRKKLRVQRNKLVEQEKDFGRRIREQSKKIKEIKLEAKSERGEFATEKARLEEMLEESKRRVQETEDALNSKLRELNETTEDLETKIAFEVSKVNKLTDQMKNEQERYRDDTGSLKSSLAEERSKLADVENKLKKQQEAFAVESEKLKDEIVHGEKVRQLKAREMKKRFDTIREEMTALWEEEKRTGREELVRLKEVYTDRITTLRENVKRLEKETEDADEVRAQLAAMTLEREALVDEKKKRDALLAEKELLERGLYQKIADRDVAIGRLEQEVDELKSGIQKRDDRITSVSSSFREIIGVAARLARKRASNIGEKIRPREGRRRKM